LAESNHEQLTNEERSAAQRSAVLYCRVCVCVRLLIMVKMRGEPRITTTFHRRTSSQRWFVIIPREWRCWHSSLWLDRRCCVCCAAAPTGCLTAVGISAQRVACLSHEYRIARKDAVHRGSLSTT